MKSLYFTPRRTLLQTPIKLTPDQVEPYNPMFNILTVSIVCRNKIFGLHKIERWILCVLVTALGSF